MRQAAGVGVLLALLAAAPAGAQESPCRLLRLAHADVKLDQDGAPLIPVTIGGGTEYFRLEGSPNSFIFKDDADRLGFGSGIGSRMTACSSATSESCGAGQPISISARSAGATKNSSPWPTNRPALRPSAHSGSTSYSTRASTSSSIRRPDASTSSRRIPVRGRPGLHRVRTCRWMVKAGYR